MKSTELNDKLCRIPGVIGANVYFEQDTLQEVHIVADMSRPAKEIMLDAKSVLFVCLEQPVDFRKISVARIDMSKDPGAAATGPKAPAQGPRPMLVAAYVKRSSADEFRVVVELKLNDTTVVGNSEGSPARDTIQGIAPLAVVDALSQLLPQIRVFPKVEFLGNYCVADLTVLEGDQSRSRNLIGAVRTTGDTPWDIARAMLQAVNRRISVMLLDSEQSGTE